MRERHRRPSLALVALALIALAAPVRAAPFDMNSRTCQDWLDDDEDEQEQTVAWLRGYLSAKSGTGMFDFAAVRVDVTTLKRYCQRHLDVSVISAAAQLGH